MRGGEEVFIIGKNFLKDTKVVFQENVSGKKLDFFILIDFTHLSLFFFNNTNLLHSLSDETSWKAEAEIDMELFHQVLLIILGLFLLQMINANYK